MMMKHSLFLLGLLLLCMGIARAVEYDPGPPIAVSVQIARTTVFPGQTLQLTITASDTDYRLGRNNTIAENLSDKVTISYDATGGTLRKTGVTSNPVDLTWYSPAKPGFYAILIRVDDEARYADDPPVSKIIEITVEQPGTVNTPTVRLSADPRSINIDRTNYTILTAQLLGKGADNKEIRFYATGGQLSATRVNTDANGFATVRLTVTRQDVGTVNVAAYYGTTTATTSIDVVTRTPSPPPYYPPYNSPGVLVSVNPPVLPADGQSTATVSVRIIDQRGYGYALRPVTFRTTMGRIEPYTVTDPLGYARVQLIAADDAGTGYVLADSGGLRGYAMVTFLTPQRTQPQSQPGQPRVLLTIDPAQAMADGASKVRVEALALDGDGRALVNSTVNFTTTLGTLQQSAVNTGPDGRAATTLTAPNRPGLATVTAQVGQIIAAGQVMFQDTAAGAPALDIRGWSGQNIEFVGDRLMLRQVQVQDGTHASLTQTLQLLDANARIAREVDLGQYGILIHDNYGVVRGYGTEADGKAQIVLLKEDGTPARTIALTLPAGSHLTDAHYAGQSGHLLVILARPDKTKPEIHLIGADNTTVRELRDGLESIPPTAISDDGYLVVALSGGTVQLYGPDGKLVSEGRRTDGLPATVAAVGPGGEWTAVASAQPDQAQNRPRVTAFSKDGLLLAAYDFEALDLVPAGKSTLAIATDDRTIYLDLAAKRAMWSVNGRFERFLAQGGYGVIAGMRDSRTNALISRVVIVRLQDGTVVATQDFNDLRSVNALLPAGNGLVNVITALYTLSFPLPK